MRALYPRAPQFLPGTVVPPRVVTFRRCETYPPPRCRSLKSIPSNEHKSTYRVRDRAVYLRLHEGCDPSLRLIAAPGSTALGADHNTWFAGRAPSWPRGADNRMGQPRAAVRLRFPGGVRINPPEN